MSRQQFSTIFCGFFSPETESSTYEEQHRQQLVAAVVARRRHREVELHVPLASIFGSLNFPFLERDLSYEERHRQGLVVEEGRHLQQLVAGLDISLALISFPWNLRFLEGDHSYEERHLQQPVVAAARQRHQGVELMVVLAWTSDSEFLVSEESFTYEEQHRQGLAAVEGRRLQQLVEEGRVLLRVVVEALPLCSSLQRRREEEEGGLQPGVAAGRLLLLGAAVVAGHLRRQREVCKGQSRLFVGVG